MSVAFAVYRKTEGKSEFVTGTASSANSFWIEVIEPAMKEGRLPEIKRAWEDWPYCTVRDTVQFLRDLDEIERIVAGTPREEYLKNDNFKYIRNKITRYSADVYEFHLV